MHVVIWQHDGSNIRSPSLRRYLPATTAVNLQSIVLSSNTSGNDSRWLQCTPDDVDRDFPSTVDGSHTDNTSQQHQAVFSPIVFVAHIQTLQLCNTHCCRGTSGGVPPPVIIISTGQGHNMSPPRIQAVRCCKPCLMCKQCNSLL